MKDGTHRRLWPKSQTEKFSENNNKKRMNFFFILLPKPYDPPRVFCKGIKVRILFFFFLIEVWLSLPHPVTRDLQREGWTFRRANVDSSVCASASKTAERVRGARGRGGGGWGGGGWESDEESVFSLRLPAFGAGDESERRWRCGLQVLQSSNGASPRAAEGPVRPCYGRARWAGAVPVGSPSGRDPARCQLGWSEQTYASLRKKILIKVHIDAIN